MYTRIFAVVLLSLSFLTTPGYCLNNACTVTLRNGNKIEANSYRVLGGQVFLKYPVGEAVIELSQVASITGADGTDLLQHEGKSQPKNEATASYKTERPTAPITQLPGGGAALGEVTAVYNKRPFGPVLAQGPAGEQDPLTQAEKERKFKEFFDRYSKADEKQRAEMDKQVDGVYSDYFGEAYTSDPE